VKKPQIFTSDLENIAIKKKLNQSMDFRNMSKTPKISIENSQISIQTEQLPGLVKELEIHQKEFKKIPYLVLAAKSSK
jgi:hypothetical protein